MLTDELPNEFLALYFRIAVGEPALVERCRLFDWIVRTPADVGTADVNEAFDSGTNALLQEIAHTIDVRSAEILPTLPRTKRGFGESFVRS